MPAEMEICTRVYQARSAVVQPLVIGNLIRKLSLATQAAANPGHVGG